MPKEGVPKAVARSTCNDVSVSRSFLVITMEQEDNLRHFGCNCDNECQQTQLMIPQTHEAELVEAKAVGCRPSSPSERRSAPLAGQLSLTPKRTMHVR